MSKVMLPAVTPRHIKINRLDHTAPHNNSYTKLNTLKFQNLSILVQ